MPYYCVQKYWSGSEQDEVYVRQRSVTSRELHSSSIAFPGLRHPIRPPDSLPNPLIKPSFPSQASPHPATQSGGTHAKEGGLGKVSPKAVHLSHPGCPDIRHQQAPAPPWATQFLSEAPPLLASLGRVVGISENVMAPVGTFSPH